MKTIRRTLFAANRQRDYPGEPTARQPVHTVYGGAHLFRWDTASKLAENALSALKRYAPDALSFERACTGNESHGELWARVRQRTVEKLNNEAVEDFRIDFEDGYGTRADSEEDEHAIRAARELTQAAEAKQLPFFIGIRIKPFSNACFDRSVRTLDLFLKTLGNLPPNFIITLPKVTARDQIVALVRALELQEKRRRFVKGALKFEFMVETTQSVLDAGGMCPLLSFVRAGKGRCVGAHLGTYDYTASHNIVATHQHMGHLACDFARQMMKVALSQTGVFLSDGATNILPVGPHRGHALSGSQLRENREAVFHAWRISFEAIRHSLKCGFYQGWDLHPAQLPVRYGALYSFFLEALEASTLRLKGFVERAAQATLMGNVFDDAATGQGLLNFFLRGQSCGALSDTEVLKTGLTPCELQSRSFSQILRGRR